MEQLKEMLREWIAKPEVLAGIARHSLWTVVTVFLAYVSASTVPVVFLGTLAGKIAHPTAKASDSNYLSFASSPNYHEIRKIVTARNVFNAEGKTPDEEAEDDGRVKKSVFDINAPCEKSKLSLKLTGTIYRGDRLNSIAVVKDSGAPEVDIYKPGDTVFDSEVKVAAVERHMIILDNAGVKECIDLETTPVTGPSAAAPAESNKPNAGPAANDSPASGEAETTVVLEGSYVEQQLGAGLSRIIQAARLVPNPVGSSINGFKIFAIDQTSLLARIGLKNNDVITRVNESSLQQPDQGLALYQSLQDSREIRINALRDGQTPIQIHVLIR